VEESHEAFQVLNRNAPAGTARGRSTDGRWSRTPLRCMRCLSSANRASILSRVGRERSYSGVPTKSPHRFSDRFVPVREELVSTRMSTELFLRAVFALCFRCVVKHNLGYLASCRHSAEPYGQGQKQFNGVGERGDPFAAVVNVSGWRRARGIAGLAFLRRSTLLTNPVRCRRRAG